MKDYQNNYEWENSDKKCVYKKVCIQKSSMKNGVYKKILQKERKKVVKKRTSKKLLIRALGSR